MSQQGREFWRSLFGLLFLFVATTLTAQTNSVVPLLEAQTVSLPLELKRGHFVVQAQMNGTNPIWLMLDTGFSITIIDPKMAENLNLHRTGKTTIAGIAGEEQADVFEGATFDFAGAAYAPRRVAALSSERKRRARRMEGIAGAGFFRRFVVEVDARGKTIKLHNPKDYQYSGKGEILPINLRNTTPVIDAAINIAGRPPVRGRFEIDTGCDGGLCLGHDFVEQNHLLEASGKLSGGERSGVGGDAQTKVGSVPQLQLGRLTVDKPETNFFQQGSPVERRLAGHIGVEVMRQFRVIFDYSRQRIILEPYG